MELADLLEDTLEWSGKDVWENERTRTPVRRFTVRLQSVGLSVRETQAVLEWPGVDRSHGAICQWRHRLADSQPYPPTVSPSRVAVDETAIEVGGEQRWIYAAIDVETKLLLDIELFSRRGTNPAASFLHRLKQRYDLSETEFLADAMEYLTALSRVGLSGQLYYTTRNHIENCPVSSS